MPGGQQRPELIVHLLLAVVPAVLIGCGQEQVEHVWSISADSRWSR
jgi:hypothetical protein